MVRRGELRYADDEPNGSSLLEVDAGAPFTRGPPPHEVRWRCLRKLFLVLLIFEGLSFSIFFTVVLILEGLLGAFQISFFGLLYFHGCLFYVWRGHSEWHALGFSFVALLFAAGYGAAFLVPLANRIARGPNNAKSPVLVSPTEDCLSLLAFCLAVAALFSAGVSLRMAQAIRTERSRRETQDFCTPGRSALRDEREVAGASNDTTVEPQFDPEASVTSSSFSSTMVPGSSVAGTVVTPGGATHGLMVLEAHTDECDKFCKDYEQALDEAKVPMDAGQFFIASDKAWFQKERIEKSLTEGHLSGPHMTTSRSCPAIR